LYFESGARRRLEGNWQSERSSDYPILLNIAGLTGVYRDSVFAA
jgi:hypothetical protein